MREDVPPMEFMYLVFTRMLRESYCRRLRSLLLSLCDVFRTLINSLVCGFLGLFLPVVCIVHCTATGAQGFFSFFSGGISL